MGRLVGYEPCPRCRARGADRRGDNLATYSDGGRHCYACGFHEFPKHFVRKVKEHGTEGKNTLPRDFSREIPAHAWKWLLSYGLPYTYWKPYTGYSPYEDRLILTVGEPIQFSIGRYVGSDAGERAKSDPGFRKWRLYGDRHGFAPVLGDKDSSSSEVVLVEDIISGHKVAQAGYLTIPLFGTDIHRKAIQALRGLKRPVTLWLDEDQYGVLPKKINRLQAFLDVPVRFIKTEKDPKAYSLTEVKEILG